MSTQKEVTTYLEDTTKRLLELLELDSTVEVKENDGGFDVVIDSPEGSGLLIGAHGATLSSIQSFLSMALKSKTDNWYRISVDIAGWKAKHEEYLVSLAKQAADRAKTTGEPQYLYNLNPSQRRVVHTALSEFGGVKSESQGDGVERYMVVTKA